MKITFQRSFAAFASIALLCSEAIAAPCGASPLPACEVPEPSSLPLMLCAIGVAVAVAKYRKK